MCDDNLAKMSIDRSFVAKLIHRGRRQNEINDPLFIDRSGYLEAVPYFIDASMSSDIFSASPSNVKVSFMGLGLHRSKSPGEIVTHR